MSEASTLDGMWLGSSTGMEDKTYPTTNFSIESVLKLQVSVAERSRWVDTSVVVSSSLGDEQE